MKLEDFNQLEFKTLGSAPLDVKLVLLGVLLALFLGAGYWFLWKPALEELEQVQNKENELRTVFLTKKKEAINLPIYRQQMVDIEKTFGDLLRQLPDITEMDGLLNDINQSGLEVGLSFELFKPEGERRAEFYVEKPISIKVTGSYHELGAFAQNIANLNRIVTLTNLNVSPAGKDGKLGITAVAKTFRYVEASSAKPASQKKRR